MIPFQVWRQVSIIPVTTLFLSSLCDDRPFLPVCWPRSLWVWWQPNISWISTSKSGFCRGWWINPEHIFILFYNSAAIFFPIIYLNKIYIFKLQISISLQCLFKPDDMLLTYLLTTEFISGQFVDWASYKSDRSYTPPTSYCGLALVILASF